MPGKRISELTALSGAGSANNDDVLIFDVDAGETKRISRSQLAEGMVEDLPFLYFHGVLTSDPTQRLNGDSLEIGDGYLRSSDMIFRYYTSSGWQNYEQIAIAAAQAWAEGTLPGGAGTYSSKEWSEQSEEWAVNPEDVPVVPGEFSALHHAAKAAASASAAAAAGTEIPVAQNVTTLKAIDYTQTPTAYLADGVRDGIYEWDATYNRQRALADNIDEHRVISPNTAVDGAWVRSNLSDKEKKASNQAKERVYARWPELSDLLNTTFLARHPYGEQTNFNSASENLSDAHYAKDCTLGTETTEWNGVTLQRIHSYSFVGGIRDLRNADYDLEDGVLYVTSMFAMAPREVEDSNGIRPPNTFTWMQGVPNGTTYGHGAKLVFPTPRRIWNVIQGGSALQTTKTVNDPTVPWASQSESATNLRWVYGAAGIGPTSPAPELWIGGMQIERAPNQSEKVGFATFGTSIDVTGNGSGDGKNTWASSRAWPRWLEGLLCAPVFDCSTGGQTSTQMEARFDTDVAPVREHAKYLVLCANVNDFNNAFNSATYRANWASIYSKALVAGWSEDEIIWLTINPRSVYDYSGGAADLEAENQYIKDTYRNVMDRAEAMADAVDQGLLREDWETDGIHSYGADANRSLGFMLYNKYRHFFRYDNVPGPYQQTLRRGGVQPLVEPAWLNMLQGAQVSSAGITAVREQQIGTAPVIEFTATLTGNTTYQMPVPYYHGDGGTPGADPTEWQVQRLFNNTTGGFSVSVQYYKRPGGTLSTVGPGIGPIPPGECWTVMTNGVTTVRVF